MYLRSISSEFEDDGARHLQDAAKRHEQMVAVLTRKHSTDVAPYPWTLEGDKKWTDAMRSEQATMLTEALAFERKAITELEKALNAHSLDEKRPG